MKIVVLQTADPHRYYRMMIATARTALEYCQRHDLAYESYVGVKRGHHGWHAAFNRIFQFQELIDRGFEGWALYLDADAFIYDLDFDLRAYLADKIDRAGIMTTIPGAANVWSINSGVMLLNLGHPAARDLVSRWMKSFMDLSDDWLRANPVMLDYDNDQFMLFNILDGDAKLRDAIHFERENLMNLPDSRFVRQFLTAFSPSLEARILALEAMTNAVVGAFDHRPDSVDAIAVPIVRGLYRALLGRAADAAGLETYPPIIREEGPDYGTERLVNVFLASDEFKARNR